MNTFYIVLYILIGLITTSLLLRNVKTHGIVTASDVAICIAGGAVWPFIWSTFLVRGLLRWIADKVNKL